MAAIQFGCHHEAHRVAGSAATASKWDPRETMLADTEARRNHESKHFKPWQFDWKRPLWRRPARPAGPTIDDAEKSMEGRVVHHSAAALLREEVEHILDRDVAESVENSSPIMTATLISTSQATDPLTKSGDMILIELIEQTVIPSLSDINDESSGDVSHFGSVCRKSRRLQWPSRIHQHAAANLVACCLCRQVPNSSTSQTKDAIKMVHLLGLEDGGVPQTDTLEGSSPFQPHEHGERHEEVSNVVGDEERLLLACLTMDGQVHVYDACELLSTSNKNHPTSTTRGDAFQSSMEALLLGRDVLAAVKATILPLCHPIRTISISLLWHKNRYTHGKGLEVTVEEEGEDAKSEEEQSSKVFSSSRTSVWDPRIWDSTTDIASLPFFTKSNHPTHCVSAFDYLIVAGKGRKKRHRSNKIPQEPSSWVSPVDSLYEAAPSITSFETGTSRTTLDTSSQRSRPENGGFMSFISLRNFLHEKTVYLPFVPRDISPFCWGDSEFLLVLGYASQDALAVHVDTISSHDTPFGPVLLAQEIPEALESSSTPEISESYAKDRSIISIPRFQMVPISLPDTQDLTPLVAGSPELTKPPAIAFVVVDEHEGQVSVIQRTLQALSLVANEEYGPSSDFNRFVENDGRAIVFQTHQHDGHVARITLPPDVTVELSRVWCYLGQGWCLLGIDTRRFFVCWEGASALSGAFIEQLNNDEIQESCAFSAAVLPVRPTHRAALQPAKTINRFPIKIIPTDGVSPSSQIGETASPLNRQSTDTINSPAQKGKFLIRQLTSWMRLDNDSCTCYDRQQLVTSVRFGVLPSSCAVLSLRRVVVQNGSASPFQQILEWLTIHKDFFSAASVALDLLHDTKSLRLLWISFDKLEDDDEREKLEGLLDGIYPMPSHAKEPGSCDAYQPHLSDMTVSLLIHGGLICASTLDHFLSTNPYYDASRACAMLAAAAACAVSAEIAENCAMDIKSTIDETHFDNKMWSLRCLLRAGVSRNCLSMAIKLLDSMIPNVLRHRCKQEESFPSMALSVSIVKLILASSVDAAEILLGLTDNVSDLPYWLSLDRDMQLALSIIEIHGEYVLLKQREVRCWVLQELQHSMSESTNRANTHSSWVLQLASASLINAGCDAKVLLQPIHIPPELSEFDLHRRHGQLICETRKYFETDRICLLLDFPILITALLLLLLSVQIEDRSAVIPEVSLQTVINAACYTAGQHLSSDSHSMTDYVTLLRYCTIADNIQAGANLIGGQDGLVLECCGILISECGIGMDEAEAWLLTESNQTLSLSSPLTSMERFTVNQSLVHLLWMLEQNVLLIRTFGDFHVGAARGKVDPVAAARLCLRTWWCVTKNDLGRSSPWLTTWLERGLEMRDGTQSPHRLACAALLRALLWPPSSSADEDVTMLSMLDLAPSFTVSLAQSACGLFEAIPSGYSNVHWLSWNGKSGEKDFKSASTETSQESAGLNESFASAVSSIRADEDW